VCQLNVEWEDVRGGCLLCGDVGAHLAVDEMPSRDEEGRQNPRVGGGRVLSVSQY
jgi:hypothetical protein